jgi:hypothetical protein
MEHPKDVGDRSTLAVLLALVTAGYRVLVPVGENTRYDAVIDEGIRLARVQIKTGRLRLGAVRFNVCSTYGHHRNPATCRRPYHGQIDYFAVYCPETTGVYLVPIEDLPVRTNGALRVEPPRNGQHLRIRMAADYEICRVAATAEPGAPADA